jgi:hypothetical protein
MERAARMSAVCLIAALAAGVALSGSAWAVKAPTAEERKESVSKPHQQRDIGVWRDAKSGCPCGESRVKPGTCYKPREGQLCCNPNTGKCEMMDTKKVNLPFQD